MIKHIRGNIFDTSCQVIGHGVNCSGGFGSGIAGQIAELYPKAREEFSKKTWKLGEIQVVETAAHTP